MIKTLLAVLCLIIPAALFAQTPVENYPEDPASVEHADVPKGEIIKLTFENSKIFPGTWREYSIYVPAQYDPAKPACVWVNQDGIQFKAPTVFDNLINSKEMPVTIGVFVTPGQVRATDEKTALNRYNRSFEYDGLGDAYVRFILEEILPDVEKHKTMDGRAIHLSINANDRGIGGSSSGAIAAFNAAWERPDAFSRVFSSVGTYIGLRGADRFPALIRKYEAKPIRVFIQDGSNDLNIYAGDWFKANEMMERSLKFAGYQVQAIYGEGGHNGKMATAYFPQAMRFLWKDHPNPVSTEASKNDMLKAIIAPGEGWEPIKAADGDKLMQVSTQALAKNGNKYMATGNKLYLVKPDGQKILVSSGLSIGGVALTPDQTQLYTTETTSHWIWIFQIKGDGTLVYKQRYGWLYAPDTADNAGAGGIKCDTAGRVYVATRMGIQVLDQPGRVNAILPVTFGQPTNLWFGGADLNILYAVISGKTYQRKLNVRGVGSNDAPIKPAKPHL
ncbi:MAG: SMP-30/gluconolactonase/LRE family protein [Bacteroidota bacterium]